MPVLPYESQVDVRSLRTRQEINSPADPNAFGYQVGVANERAGNATMQAGMQRLEFEAKEIKRKREENVANRIANFDFAETENALKNEVDANATDYRDQVVSKYRDKVETYVEAIEDDEERTLARERLIEKLPAVADRASDYQYKVGNLNSELEANSSLATLQNKITVDPTNYDMYVQQGYDVINTRPNMPEVSKAGMRDNWKNDGAKRRFNGMLDKADSIEALDAVAAELTGQIGGRDWAQEFKPEDFESTINAIGTRRKTFETQFNTAATAAIDTIEDRDKSLTLIPPDELQNVQATVRRSPDPEKNRRVARIMRNQSIIKDRRALPPSEQTAMINAANGSPGLAYPDLPVEVSQDINIASSVFGVDAGFMGGLVTRESGSMLKRPRAKTNPSFAPQVIHKGVDTRNMRPEVVDALAVAGEQMGKPVMLVKGGVSNNTSKSGSGASVSTVGMSGEDKAILVGSLVDSGFTGVSEYDDYIRVDFLSAVPKDFGKEANGKVWGGWTNLSPEIVAVLKDKGFKAGGLSQDIKRSNSAKQAGIDYGFTTQIKDAAGKPTSSAVGVTQMTGGTFLGLMKNPDIAAAIQPYVKTDLSKLTDAELLELRKDRTVSILSGGAYAAQNTKTLENALGRSVSSAEVYMAHFMGAGGAIGFINAYQNNPSQSAAKLMPKAAEANKPVFYKDGKELSVSEIYGNISNGFALDPSRIVFEDNEVAKRILKQTEQELADDPMTHAANVGSHVVTALDEEGGFAARGQQAMAVAQYNGIPVSQMKPFMKTEVSFLKAQIDKGDDETTLGIMASIQSMGSVPAKAAMKQLEVKDPVFAHAGDLYLEGSQEIAESIIKGKNRIIKNPDIVAQMGMDDSVPTRFQEITNRALLQMRPESRDAVQEAAVAHWIERASSGKKLSFDSETFKKSVQAVLGGAEDSPALDDVNGEITLLPKGLDGDTLESAIERMTLADWSRMSSNGKPPKLRDGSVIDPADIRDEVKLRAIGANTYKVQLSDGTYLLRDGNKPFEFVPDIDYIKEMRNRPRSYADTKLKTNEIPIYTGYNPFGGF